jgi:hypothetical protein
MTHAVVEYRWREHRVLYFTLLRFRQNSYLYDFVSHPNDWLHLPGGNNPKPREQGFLAAPSTRLKRSDSRVRCERGVRSVRSKPTKSRGMSG